MSSPEVKFLEAVSESLRSALIPIGDVTKIELESPECEEKEGYYKIIAYLRSEPEKRFTINISRDKKVIIDAWVELACRLSQGAEEEFGYKAS